MHAMLILIEYSNCIVIYVTMVTYILYFIYIILELYFSVVLGAVLMIDFKYVDMNSLV